MMRILFLQKRLLFPTDTGGKIRTLNIIRHLARWHEVTYLCNVQQGEAESVERMRELGLRVETVPWTETPRGTPRFYGELALNLCSRYPYNVNKDFDPPLRRRAQELLAGEPYDLVVCDFVQMARNAIGLPVPATVLFQHNVEAEIFKRHTETDAGRWRRAYMRIQWKKMARFEAAAGWNFDRVVAVSQRDRDIFERDYGWNHVDVIDTAVDTDYFQPQPQREVEDRVVFVGSLDWLPNEDGVIHFVRNIWPKIRARRPAATFQIVGRNPTPAVSKLAERPGVEVVGTVPDVRPCLTAASVVVVPLRIGGGTRLKIFEAMAMQKAIVSTSLGAEGLDVEDGTHLLLADDPETFANAVGQLLDDPSTRSHMAARALQLVRENFTAEAIARQFEDICRRAAEREVDRELFGRELREAPVGSSGIE